MRMITSLVLILMSTSAFAQTTSQPAQPISPFANATVLHCMKQSPSNDSPHITQNITLEMSNQNPKTIRLDEYNVNLTYDPGSGNFPSFAGQKKILKWAFIGALPVLHHVTESFVMSFTSNTNLGINLSYPVYPNSNVDEDATFICR